MREIFAHWLPPIHIGMSFARNNDIGTAQAHVTIDGPGRESGEQFAWKNQAIVRRAVHRAVQLFV